MQRASYLELLRRREAGLPATSSVIWLELVNIEQLINDNEWEQALTLVDSLRERASDNPYLIEKAALLTSAMGRPAEAIPLWEMVRKHDVLRITPLARIARSHLELNHLDEAESLLKRARGIDPQHREIRLLTACLYLRKDHRKEEISEALGHLDLHDMATLAYTLSADREGYENLLGAEDYSQLARHILGGGPPSLVRVIHLNKFDAWETLTDAHVILLDVESALACGRYAEALKKIDDARRIGVSGPLFSIHAAYALARSGQREKGLTRLREAVEKYPDHPRFRHGYAVALLELGEVDQARDELRALVRAHPAGDPEIRFALIAALCASGRIEETWEELEKLARERPGALLGYLYQHDARLDPIRVDARFAELTSRLRTLRGIDLGVGP